MSSPSTFSFDYTDYFVNLLKTNKAALKLGGDPTYGDVERIPFTPFACVEPGVIRRAQNGTQRRNMVELNTHIIVYHGTVQDVQKNMRGADMTATDIMNLIHADPTCGGLSFDCFVREIEPGYQKRGNSLFRATMLTVEARQQELLPLIN